jgi:CheY-like chemotaxis protein
VARILAVEPDPAQAAVLRRIVQQAGADAVIADSKEAAIAAIDSMAPDLILVSALLSPREESDIADHVRRGESIDHVQILTIPLLDAGAADEPTQPPSGFFSAFRRKRPKPVTPTGCDPERYADELKGYLQLSMETRAERDAQRAREERERQRQARVDGVGTVIAPGREDLVAEQNEVDDVATPVTDGWLDRLNEIGGTAEPDPVSIWRSPVEELGEGSTLPVDAHEEPLGAASEPLVEPISLDHIPVDSAPFEAAPFDPAPLSPIAPPTLLQLPARPEPFGLFTLETPDFALTAPTEEDFAPVGSEDIDEISSAIASLELAPRLDFESIPPATVPEPQPEPELTAAYEGVVEVSSAPAREPDAVQEGPVEITAATEAAVPEPEFSFVESFVAEPELPAADAVPVAAPPLERASMPSLEFAFALDDLKDLNETPAAAPFDDDRFSLSIASFEVDRRESDDYLLQAARDPLPPPKPAIAFADAEEKLEPMPAVEIWQALPDWVDSGPPLEAHVEAASARFPVRPAPSFDPPASTPAPPLEDRVIAPVPPPASPPLPPVDTGWIATELDALRSDILALRTKAAEVTSDVLEARSVVSAPPPGASVVTSGPSIEGTRRKKKKKKTKPIEDEWGMFDPSQAGVEALVAALEAKAEEEEADEEEDDAPFESSPPSVAPRPRLAPLSRWARRDEPASEPASSQLRGPDDLRALLEGLGVPAHVANVSYPTGCRIRRVRMARNPGRKKKAQSGEPVIILSRRALGRGPSGQDDSGPTSLQ